MRSHINSASIALWKIVETGYKAVDPTNLTRREEVECQLNATALDLIRVGVGEKDPQSNIVTITVYTKN